MALTFDSVTAHIRHTLGGDVSAETDVYDIINNAGDFMASMYPWRWLEETTALTGVNTVEWIALPTGFIELISFAPRGLDSRAATTGSNSGRFFAVSAQEIYDKREVAGDDVQNPTAATWDSIPEGAFYFAITYYSAAGTAVPVPRMELFPCPVNSGGSGSSHEVSDCKISMVYRRSWTQIQESSGDDSVFVLPQWLEPLYLQMIRAFTRGYEEEDIATTNARIAEVAAGPLFMTAVQRDSLIEATTLRVVRRNTPTGLAGLAGNAAQMAQQAGQMGG
jgi:hypothetical protein